jgi:DNA-binding NarL/FixJ family response regulator
MISSAQQVTTVLLVDSPRSVLEALRARLSLESGLCIVGGADDATLAINLVTELDPDVVVVDAEASDLDATKLVRAIAGGDKPPGVVVLTQHAVGARHRLEMVPATIVGKHEGFLSLVHAIQSAKQVCRGGC